MILKFRLWNIIKLGPLQICLLEWVNKTKFHANGSIERHKARLVAKGESQHNGIDYFDTFLPVAKLTIVRVFLATAAVNGRYLHQYDI